MNARSPAEKPLFGRLLAIGCTRGPAGTTSSCGSERSSDPVNRVSGRTPKTLGSSLLEIVVAINCTALLMAMLCQALPLARRQTREADLALSGALLASNALEMYMTVPLSQWPTDPITLAGDSRQVQLSAAPWEADSRMFKASAVVMIGKEERYRLETLVFP